MGKYYEATMPKGTYYIGDLCYVMNDDKWQSLVNEIYKDGDEGRQGEITMPFGTVVIYDTYYGDGEYEDQYFNKYSVDSGSIGLISVDLIDKESDTINDLGMIVTFDHDFTCMVNEGVLKFGKVLIDTKCDDDPFCEEYYRDESEYF